MKTVEVPLIFGKGFSAENEVLNLAIEFGLCEKSGSWYSTLHGQRFQGKSGLKTYYNEHQGEFDELKELVKNKINNTDIQQEYNIDPNTGELLDD